MNQVEKLRQITTQELAMLGVQDVAYIKRVSVNDSCAYAIYAADGTEIGSVPDRDLAFATVLQNDLEPVSVQ